MFELDNKVAVVTGVAGGIGFAIVKQFSELNVKVVLVDKSDGLEEIASKIGGNTFVINADLTKEEDLNKIIDMTVEKWGRIDILVNSAGVNVRKKLGDYTAEEWDWIQNINLKAIFQLSNKVAKVMKENKWGRIINISSTQGLSCWNGVGDFSLAPYCASKAGLIAITKAFALDLAKEGITVNAICPAFVDTPLVQPVKDDFALYRDVIARTPVGRFAKTSEVAAATVFLASEESSFITGHPLLVDGGWMIQ